ncbi:HalOD1 output domain-containing protein [Natronosalvus rutilus]|uniref:Halobacterial output domain-containing protein n=1 Tax=Natronosalvus rutilus TaxID=2953753 RepID=A0A9E7SVG9_9EURY|nr:HalOD1 output domain-containing protein [Natronosalvus rutilus]UTF52273.1 hypothetical protein NGM29_10755 [Natronosalvus rutilus]
MDTSHGYYSDGGSEEDEIRITYSPDDPPVNAVADALAQFERVEVTELKPIYDEIDTEALNEIMASAIANECTVTVSAEVCGNLVTVCSDGIITVRVSDTDAIG